MPSAALSWLLLEVPWSQSSLYLDLSCLVEIVNLTFRKCPVPSSHHVAMDNHKLIYIKIILHKHSNFEKLFVSLLLYADLGLLICLCEYTFIWRFVQQIFAVVKFTSYKNRGVLSEEQEFKQKLTIESYMKRRVFLKVKEVRIWNTYQRHIFTEKIKWNPPENFKN